jgi:hypothetical protein
MSGGVPCVCEGNKHPAFRWLKWRVTQRECNHSAFNGWHYTPSDYSTVICKDCRGVWRTKAAYVRKLRDGKHND